MRPSSLPLSEAYPEIVGLFAPRLHECDVEDVEVLLRQQFGVESLESFGSAFKGITKSIQSAGKSVAKALPITQVQKAIKRSAVPGLRNLSRQVGKAAGRLGRSAAPLAPVAGQIVGGMIGGPAGVMVGRRLGDLTGQALAGRAVNINDFARTASFVGKDLAPYASVAGQVVGGIYGGPAGAAVGGQLGSLAGQALAGEPIGANQITQTALGAVQAAGGIPGIGAIPVGTVPAGAVPAGVIADMPVMPAPLPPAATGAVPASVQLLNVLGRPEIMQALAAMALGSVGNPSVQVGDTEVPVDAVTNMIASLAQQASEEIRIARWAEADEIPAYLAGETGDLLCDPTSAEQRASVLYERLLSADFADSDFEGDDEESEWSEGYFEAEDEWSEYYDSFDLGILLADQV